MTNTHPLLERLISRSKERVGKLVKFPIELKEKIKVDTNVWVQPLYQAEADGSKMKAITFCKGRFEDEDSRIEAQNMEALVYAYRDADDHDISIFENSKQIRELFTPDEIALLVHQLNIVTYSLSSWQISEDKHASLELAKQIAENENTDVVDLMHSTELVRVILDLSKEIDKLKQEINGRSKS